MNDGEEDDVSREDDYIGPVLAGGHRFDRKLSCIKYPGVVVNVNKAIETLGGITSISTVSVMYRLKELLNYKIFTSNSQ